MTHSLLAHRIERLLVDAIDRLCDEFPALPVGVVSRCVEAARVATHASVPRDLAAVAGQIEAAARDDLARIDEALRLESSAVTA